METIIFKTKHVTKYRYGGKLHRLDGPAIEYRNGDIEYWQFGKRHRIDGPAIHTSYFKKWYQHGKLHREYGPAVERRNDKEYWFCGKNYTLTEYKKLLKY